ncbi:MAG: DUF4199 domain-containing protein [Pseudomonadota bacterium]
MLRLALLFGGLAGTFVAAATIIGITLNAGQPGNRLIGYLVMLLGMALIFVGVKHYRDRIVDGDISFGRAVLLGLMITGIGSITYAVLWDIYLVATDFAVISAYAEVYLENERQAGATSRELEALAAQQRDVIESYQNPLFRIAIAVSEILPVGMLITLLSAAVLSNRNFMPSGTPPTAN